MAAMNGAGYGWGLRIEKYDGDAEPAGQAPAKRLFRRNQLDLPWVLLLAFRRQSEMLRDNITTCRHLLKYVISINIYNKQVLTKSKF